MQALDKKVISANFSKKAAAYEQNARLQNLVARELVKRAENFRGQIVDLGAGTGALRKLTNWNMVEVDISYGMCRQNSGQVINADIEQLPFADNSFDNAISSLSLQWTDIEKAINETSRILKPGGNFAFSIFSPTSLSELKNAFAYLDSEIHLMQFTSPMKVYAIMKKAGFINVAIELQKISYAYDDIFSLLHSIKSIGASYNFARAERGLRGKTYFHKLENLMKQLSGHNGKLILSWEVLYVTASSSSS